MFKFQIGERVKDIVTGYKGIVVARTEYLTGCARYSVQSEKLSKDTGRPQDWQAFDENQLSSCGSIKTINKDEPKKEKPITGGPRPEVSRAPSPAGRF